MGGDVVSVAGSHSPLTTSVQQVPEQICTLALATAQIVEGPCVLMGPQNARAFASQLSPDGSAVLVQKDPATFFILQLPNLKVYPA